MSQREKAAMFTHTKRKVLAVLFVLFTSIAICRADIMPTKDNIVKDVSELEDLYETMIPTGVMAPAFKLKDLNGEVIDSKDYLGKELTLIYFWSVFCPYCKKGLPEINVIAEKHKARGLKVLTVNLDGIDFERAVRKFAKEKKIKTTIPLDELNKKNMFFAAADPYGVNQTPTVFLVNESGEIIYNAEYSVDYAVIEELVLKNTDKTQKIIGLVIISILAILVVASILAYILFIRPAKAQQKIIDDLKRRTQDERNKNEVST